MNRKLIKFLTIICFIITIDIIFIMLTEKRYCNSCAGSPNFIDFLKWKINRSKPNNWPELAKINSTSKFIHHTIAQEDEIAITYINHASVLIQTKNANIITDPIWSEYAGPFGKFGAKRSLYPGVNLNDLPKIDYILISHSHYDHLDNPSINMLTKNQQPILITGLGVSRYIDYCSKLPNKCIELNWWDKKELAGLKFNFVPSYHWSSRYLLDKNTSLWGGFVIETPAKQNIYFAGDTGFSDGKIFKEIKAKFKNIYLSLLPIGAYKPEWFFSNMHIGPSEAVKISKILDSKYAIPIHYDVFLLTDDGFNEPLSELKKATKNCLSCKTEYNVLSLGKTQIYIPHQ